MHSSGLEDGDTGGATSLDSHDRQLLALPQGCQVEEEFTDEEWVAFIACARTTWGEFIHNDFEAKRQDKHPEVRDADIDRAIRRSACLVVYGEEGDERLALYDVMGRGLVVVAKLAETDHGVYTAYFTGNFDRRVRKTKTNAKWLRKPP